MQVIDEVIKILESAKRLGAEKDDPEGTRYIQISDTLVKKLITILRGRPIENSIEFISDWRGGPYKCGIIDCEKCGGHKFVIYDGGGTPGCAGGMFIIVCSDCGHRQVLLDDEA